MFEKMFKGMFVLTVWGFILIAVAALLPDSAWENFPEKLSPVRDFLAEKSIISSQFRPENRGNKELAKKSPETQTLPVTAPTDITGPKAPAESPRQSFTGISQTASSAAAAQPADSGTAPSNLVIPPFPSGTGSAELDKNRVSVAESLPQQSDSQGLSSSSSAKSAISTVPATGTSDLPAINIPKTKAVVSNSNDTKKNSNDTLPELSFDSTSPLAGPSSEQTLSIDTSILSTSGTSTTKTPATPLPSPGTVTAPASEPEKLIGNATLPDIGVISTTSASNANGSPFPTVGHLNPNTPSGTATPVNATATDSVPASPVLTHSTPASQVNTSSPAAIVPSPAQPLVNPSQELVQALVLSRNPNETKTAFFKLNQLLERYSDTYTAAELEQLHKALDRLAFTLFYDPKQHVLEPEYVVGAGESLVSIAGAYKITPEHLAALNGLADPNVALTPGTKLKVVRGPVTANVSMSKKELLLLYDGLYAGRFKMGYAANAKALRGILSVTRKIASPQYIGPLENGTQGEIAGGDPRNPLGPFWIELNNGLGLQGTNHPEFVGTETAQQGGLIFSNKDITHLNILLPPGANIYLKD